MNEVQPSTIPVDPQQLDEVAEMTPFPVKQLQGQRFARGNMLGGAVPVKEAENKAPWIPQK
jgi:hypothetical protein